MKIKFTPVVLLVTLSLISSASSSAATLKTDQQKASYAIGLNIGGQMKSQGLTIDAQALTAGITDASSGNKPKLSEAEMKAAMEKLQETMTKKQEVEGKKNLEEGKAYLEKNKAAKGVKVTASGLQYEILKEAKGDKPKATDKVKVHYHGTLINGSIFDSSVQRNTPAEFPVSGVIKGWIEALQLMPVGSKWKLTIPADIAYGPSGRPGIPPNSVLVFEVELLEIMK